MPERLQAGHVFAERYTIQRELGRGGTAIVYLAEDAKHRRPVALKVLRPELAEVLGRDRFEREIEIAARLAHPNILPLFDSGEADGLFFYVMPYVGGESLRDRLQREVQLPVDEAVGIALAIADALAHAHAAGVVHRDIKPENVLFQSGHAVVADFGIARAISAAAGDRLTHTGLVVGTPAYMSPEQASGALVDGRTDVYSLATVLYEMLSGRPPYDGATAQVMLARRLTEPVAPLRAQRDTVPEHIEAAVTCALARLPADRFRTVEAFAAALRSDSSAGAVRAPASTGPAGSRPRDRRRRATLAMGGGAVLLVASALALGRWGGGGPGLSSSRLVVFPFAMSGSGALGYLGEGMVDLLSRNLDGVGSLHSVDPGTIITTLGRGRAGAILEVAAAREVAGRVGAGVFVLGTAHTLGSTLRLNASLYRVGGTATDPIDQMFVEGDTTDVPRLVDELAAKLLIRLGSGLARSASARPTPVNTRSLEALRLYLSGEQTLRLGDRAAAIGLFQDAIASDSGFALAHFRLAVAAGWSDRHDLSSAATTTALAYASRLSERDRRMLEAYARHRRGEVEAAERGYRAILEDYPGDLEAEFLLADLMFHYNPLRGRPAGEAREPFDQVLAFDPGFL